MNTFKREWHFDVVCSAELRQAIFDLCETRESRDICIRGSGPRLDRDYLVIPGEYALGVRVTGPAVGALTRLLRKHNSHEVNR